MRRTTEAFFAIALFAHMWAAPARAHFDFMPVHDGTMLVLGGYDDGGGVVGNQGPLRVFEFDVEEIVAGTPYQGIGEPGVHSVEQAQLTAFSALPPGQTLGFSFQPITIGGTTRNLWYWDGSGSPNFAPVGASTVFTLDHPSNSNTASITGADAGTVAGFTIGTTVAGPDTIHQHLDTTLGTAGGEPNLGIYLLSVDFNITGGLQNSEPAFMVFATLDPGGLITEAMHEDAVGWVEANLLGEGGGNVGAIPEPGTLALSAAGAIGFLSRLRRRRN